MFATQWSLQDKMHLWEGEVTGLKSQVVQTAVKGNSERLAQMMLAGQYVDAERVGYQFGPEDKVPQDLMPMPGRNTDPVEMLQYVEAFGKRIRESMRKAKEDEHERLETERV